MNEKDLITNLKLDNKEAQEIVFKENVKWAVSLAYLVLRDWKEAEDAVQNAFINAFRGINNFDQGKAFKPWFTRIIVNEAKKIRKKNFRWIFSEEVKEIEINNDGIEGNLILTESKTGILEEIYKLKEKYRIVIILKYYSGFSEKEISECLKLPISTIKSRLYVARQELKDNLLEYREG